MAERRLQVGSRALAAGVVLAAVCVLGWAFYLEVAAPHEQAARSYPGFAAEIRCRTERPVIFFRTEPHEVAFHVGRPLDTILEWENLDHWASLPHTIYMVMPPECAASWPQHLQTGRLEEVLRSASLGPCEHERPLVLMRSLPQAGKADERVVR
jgi:hypothetical protein